MDHVADLLFLMRSKGVTIWSDHGQLRYQAPKGVLTTQEIEKLKAWRAQISAFLEKPRESSPPALRIAPRLSSDRVPLTFSQQLWWSCLELQSRSSVRSVAAAMRLKGPLDIGALRQSISQLVRRHESLRTRIIVASAVPIQHVDEPREFELESLDLTRYVSGHRDLESLRLTTQIVNEPFNVAAGPLLAVRLLKLEDLDWVLAVATDHMISDLASLAIVWREIFTVYGQLVRRVHLAQLPRRTPTQFPDYAVWQQKSHKTWLETHGAYWRSRLAGAKRVSISLQPAASDCEKRWAILPIEWGEQLTTRLREFSRSQKTTLVMSVLTAYVAALFRWCHARDLVLPFVVAGRVHPELEETIGYFGTALFLRMELLESDRFLDLLERVTQEYSVAYTHFDSGHVAAEMPRPEFIWNPRFNWVPRNFGIAPPEDIGIRVSPWNFEVVPRDDIQWDGEFELRLSDTEGGLAGVCTYRADLISQDTVRGFARSLRGLLETMVREPAARLTQVRYPD